MTHNFTVILSIMCCFRDDTVSRYRNLPKVTAMSRTRYKNERINVVQSYAILLI